MNCKHCESAISGKPIEVKRLNPSGKDPFVLSVFFCSVKCAMDEEKTVRDEALEKGDLLNTINERDEARHALLTLHAREHLTCGWCGDMMHAPPGFTPPMTTEKLKQTVKIHMLDCPKHPIRETEREFEELREEVRLTLMENLHLADGDQCTLKRLKDAIGFELPPENES